MARFMMLPGKGALGSGLDKIIAGAAITSIRIGTNLHGGGLAGSGLQDPGAEGGEGGLRRAVLAVDQPPSRALAARDGEGRNQTAGRDVVVYIRPDSHCDPDTVRRGLQRLAVLVEGRPRRA